MIVAGCGLDVSGLSAGAGRDAALTGNLDSSAMASADEGGDDSTPLNEAATLDTGVSALIDSPNDTGSISDGSAAPDGEADAIMPGSDAGASVDGGQDGGQDVGTGVDAAPPCTSSIPAGWSLALYGLGSPACPTSFTSHDVLGAPVIGASACSCTCSVTQDGTCTQGSFTVNSSSGAGSSCNSTSTTWTVNGPGCTLLGYTMVITGPLRDQALPLPPQGGSCSGTLQTDSSQLSAPAARYCEVPMASADSVCGGTPPTGFAACITTSGITTCPAGTPFVNAYVVEDAASLQCASCSACSVQTTCSGAMLTGFADTTCRVQEASVPIDGACNTVTTTTGYSTAVNAIEYTATAATTCTAGSSTATAQLSNPRTLCCR